MAADETSEGQRAIGLERRAIAAAALTHDGRRHDDRRPFARELSTIEVRVAAYLVRNPTWLAAHDEAALRWALSFARLSKVFVPKKSGGPRHVDIGHALDGYRHKLHQRLAPCIIRGRIGRDAMRAQIPAVRALARQERDDLLRLLRDQLPASALDHATRRRPFSLVLGGGGGTCYSFVGAMDLLEESGLRPDIIVGTSMGGILGAFRCREKELDLEQVKGTVERLTFRRVFRAFETESRFGLPATLKLHLREVIGHEFERDGRYLRMNDLAIPFRVCVSGIAQVFEQQTLDTYAHLLDDAVDKSGMRLRVSKLVRAVLKVARAPLKPIYLGGDNFTKEFDVLDAIGFSSAVPAVIHYDILRDDPRMVQMARAVLEKAGVSRFVDGGVSDNLPSAEAWRSVQAGEIEAYDPFVLALDSFAPQLNRHFPFLPLMTIAAENTKVGRDRAHMTITYKNVLSPMTVVPTPTEFEKAIEWGRGETEPFIATIRKMVGPIPDPPGVLSERDGL